MVVCVCVRPCLYVWAPAFLGCGTGVWSSWVCVVLVVCVCVCVCVCVFCVFVHACVHARMPVCAALRVVGLCVWLTLALGGGSVFRYARGCICVSVCVWVRVLQLGACMSVCVSFVWVLVWGSPRVRFFVLGNICAAIIQLNDVISFTRLHRVFII